MAKKINKRFIQKKKKKPLFSNMPKKKKFIPTIKSNIYCPKIVEPKPICKLCEKPIETISDAISEGEGQYSHFACVIKKIGKDEKITDNQKISYLGKGCFGIIETIEGHFTITKKINYETPESFSAMKTFVENQKK